MRAYTHICICSTCKPEHFAVLDRSGPHYYSGKRDWHLDVYKGEEKVGDTVTELNATLRWAVRVSLPHHICKNCMRNICMYVDHGEFRVVQLQELQRTH